MVAALTQESRNSRNQHERGRPDRQPNHRLRTVGSLRHTENYQGKADNPDTRFAYDQRWMVCFVFRI